jgi:hypothetical protein
MAALRMARSAILLSISSTCACASGWLGGDGLARQCLRQSADRSSAFRFDLVGLAHLDDNCLSLQFLEREFELRNLMGELL